MAERTGADGRDVLAAGTFLKLAQGQMTQALALAAAWIGDLMVAANTSVAREYHAGLSAMLGIHAALAAHKGFVAEGNVLEMAWRNDGMEPAKRALGKTAL